MKRALLRPVLLGLVLIALSAAGCATVERKEFDDLAYEVAKIGRQQQSMLLRVNQLDAKLKSSRQPQAEMVADLTSMRRELAVLRGQLDERAHQMQNMSANVDSASSKRQAALDERLARMEKFLGVTKDGKITGPPPPPQAPKAAQAKLPDTAEGLYGSAHDLYKHKNYTAARARFQLYLKKYPRHKYAGHAHYWIGETYYQSRDYENAILSYNQVIKRYKRSSKVPSALLKQGLAFIQLQDKRTAKIVLDKLVKDYPKSGEATYARKKLKGL